jgi:hypothetical protein
MSSDNREFKKVMCEFLFYENLSRIAYQSYINDGSKFIYATLLFDYNESARNILVKNLQYFNEDIIEFIYPLVFHYDIWMKSWLNLNNQKIHNLQDEFKFENNIGFPHKSVEKIKETLNNIKK